MRAVVQTVSRACVTVDDEVVGAIGEGLLVLLGVTHDDSAQTARTMARKVHELRILDEERSAAETGAEVLVVSQFTLYGDARKGRRPSYVAAAPPELAALAEALKYYYAKTKNPVTYEYIVFNEFNDELSDAAELAAFCKHVPCKVNIIEYNPIDAAKFLKPDEDTTMKFMQHLEKNRVNVRLRRSRGKDIDAACGQLANKN